MVAALLGRDKKFDLIAEEEQSDLVVVVDCAECQNRGHLGGELALAQIDAAECPRGADIDHQHHRHLSFFCELLHVGRIHARCDVPVDRPDLIARRILPHLFKVHSPTFEDAVILAGECGAHQPPGSELQPSDLFEDFFWVHLFKKC